MSDLSYAQSGANDNGNHWEELNFFDSFCDVDYEGELQDLSLEFKLPTDSDNLTPQEGVELQVPPENKPLFTQSETATDAGNADKAVHGVIGTGQQAGVPAASLPLKASSSKNSSNPDPSKVKSDEKQQLKRKKAIIAAKANREKKKRELKELRRSNAELMKERQEFRRIIADLQLQAQANREAGEIDLETENELLRAELQAHKSFIAQFKRVADGTAVSNKEKHTALLKGAKAAVGQVVGLLNTSTVDPSWKRGYSRLHPEVVLHYQRLPYGTNSKTAARINIRLDIPPVKAPLDFFHGIQWRIWSDSDLSHQISSNFGPLQEKEIKEISVDLDELGLDRDPGFKVKVYYHREKRPVKNEAGGVGEVKSSDAEGTANVDTLFLTTSMKQELPYNGTPAGPNGSQSQQRQEEPKIYPTFVMANTTTTHSKDIVSAKPDVHRIESALLEGSVIRQLENGVISCTILNSYPLNQSDENSGANFLSASNPDGLIDDEGFFTQAAEQAANDHIMIFAEFLGPEAAKAYAEEAMEAAKAAANSNKPGAKD